MIAMPDGWCAARGGGRIERRRGRMKHHRAAALRITNEIMSKRDDLHQLIEKGKEVAYRLANRPYDFDLCSYSPLRSFRTV
jgi:hypothetical protein